MTDFLEGMIHNVPLWTAVLAWAVAQLIKIIIDLSKSKKIKLSLFISSGGMPSSHSAFVTAITTAIGLTDGFNTSIFALSVIVSLVVMYDASGVRRAAGNHAAVINMIVENIETQGIILDKKLKELLGHTPLEVFAGGLLGVLIALIRLL